MSDDQPLDPNAYVDLVAAARILEVPLELLHRLIDDGVVPVVDHDGEPAVQVAELIAVRGMGG
jgi:hypothetical protein